MAVSQTIKVIFDGKDNTSKAINTLKGNLGKADAAVSRIKSSLGGMTGAIGLAAGAAGFGMLARSALETADKLGKASERMGVAASELSSLQLAASYAGLETDTFTKLLGDFQNRIGEAAQGTGEAAKTLRELGVDAKEFAKLPLDEQLKVIADKMLGLGSATEKAQVAADLFGARGIKLINFLNLGSEGINDLRDEFKRLGMEITDKQIDNIEDFNDSMTKLKAIINQAMIVGLAQAAPQMEQFAEKAAEMAVPLVGQLMKGLQYIIDNAQVIGDGLKYIAAFFVAAKVIAFANGVIMLGTALAGMAASAATTAAALAPIGTLLAGAGAIGYGIGTLIDNATGASTAVANWAAELTGLNDRIKAAKGGTDGMSGSVDAYSGETDDAAGETTNLKDKIEDLQKVVVTATRKDIPGITDTVVDLAKEEQKAAKETLELKEALEKLRENALKPQKDLKDYIAKMEILRGEFEDGKRPIEEYEAMVKQLTKEFTGVESEVEKVRREISDLQKAIELNTKVFGENSEQVRALEKELESLGGELVDAIKETSNLTENQKKLLEETTSVEKKIADLNQDLDDLESLLKSGAISNDQYARAVKGIREEMVDLNNQSLSDFERAVQEAFDDTPVGEFIGKIEDLTGQGGTLSTLIGSLGTTQTAISGCFGTTPVTNFGDAIKQLFTGSGSALGGFGAALTGLTDALSGFFSGALSNFSSFKDAIIRTLEQIAAAAIASVGINFLKNLIPGIKDGGIIEGFAVGGRVTGQGGPREDRVPAMLSAGEYVIQASSVSKFGQSFFDSINAGKMPGLSEVLPGFRYGGIIQKFLGGPFVYGGYGYDIDNAEWDTFLRMLYETLDQTDPRDDPLEAYDAAAEIIVSRIGKAISDAIGAIDKVFGTQIIAESKVGEIISGVLGPLGNLGTQDFLNQFKVLNKDSTIDGIYTSIFDYLFGLVNSLKFAPIGFNMDDVFKELFNRSDAIAMGDLFIQGRQFGGPLERGQASLVGEDGPELFIPDSRGRVSPIAKDGGQELIAAVREVKQEVAALRRQMDRQNPVQLLGGRSA